MSTLSLLFYKLYNGLHPRVQIIWPSMSTNYPYQLPENSWDNMSNGNACGFFFNIKSGKVSGIVVGEGRRGGQGGRFKSLKVEAFLSRSSPRCFHACCCTFRFLPTCLNLSRLKLPFAPLPCFRRNHSSRKTATTTLKVLFEPSA